MLLSGSTHQAPGCARPEPGQEVDSLSTAQLPVTQEWEEQEVQVSELESSSSPDAVMRESFCQCVVQAPGLDPMAPGLDPMAPGCLCGEEDDEFEWVWEETSKSTAVSLSCEGRKASFHTDYSCGTVAIRGTKALAEGQHFWEIKMTSPVYGTDMMVGIGTSEVNLDKFKYSFCSLLGNDEDSWGLSYTGLLQHGGTKEKFSPRFGQGSIIGVHLDTWHGTLTFYKNRRCIGVATTRLQNKSFYPMVCSTAAKSSMKVIRVRYTPTSLQYFCCAGIRRLLPCCPDVLRNLDLPPGLFCLLQSKLGWVFNLHQGSPLPSPSPMSTPSASTSPSPCPGPYPSPSPSLVQDTLPSLCACQVCPQVYPQTRGTCVCPPTPPCSDCESSCSSEPEDYQSKRCCWT